MSTTRRLAGAVALAAAIALPAAQPAQAAPANVAALQVALKASGLYGAQVDGVAGPNTRRAVRRLQRRRHIAVDGIAGPQTRRALGRRGRPALGSRVIHSGHSGWDVAALQFLLAKRGFSPGVPDGGYGSLTERAVRRYQAAVGLGVDGIAGPATIAALRRGRTARPAPTTPTPPTVPVGSISFLRPLGMPVGDGFGWVSGRRHTGLDFPAGYGTLVAAAGVGTTIFAGWNSGGYGNLVVIQHRLGFTSWYAHLSTITSWVGEAVSGGTRIGYVGSTGRSTGPHLHFEVRQNNVPLDPTPYLLSSVAARATAAAAGGRSPRVDYARERLVGHE